MLARNIRIAVANDALVAPVDVATGKPPEFWAGSPVRLLLAFTAAGLPALPAALAGVQVQIKAASAGSAPADDAPVLALATCSQLATDVTAEHWAAGLAAHAVFEIPGEALAFNPGAYWMIIIGYDAAGNSATLSAGRVALKGDGYAAGTPAPPPVISAADTIAAKKVQVLADADTARAAALEALQAKASAREAVSSITFGTGSMGWDFVAAEEYVGTPPVRFPMYPIVSLTGWMFGTGAEASTDGVLKSVSMRVGAPGAASVVIGRLQKAGTFTPRLSAPITLVLGVMEYAVGLPILRGETVFLHCGGGSNTYRTSVPGQSFWGYNTAAVPTTEVPVSKNIGGAVCLGFTVAPYDRDFDMSPAAWDGYSLPPGWTLANGVLTAGGATGDTAGRRCIGAKKYYATRRAWEFDVHFNGSIIQFGFAAISAWPKSGTTVGIDPSARAFVLYEARDAFGALSQQSVALIPAALDFGTKCRVRLVRMDRVVSVTLTDATGVAASIVSTYPAGDYYEDAGNSFVGVCSAGWASDQPFLVWYSGSTAPAFSAPRHTLLGHAPVLALGDSITEGYGFAGDSWAVLAAKALGLRFTVLARCGCRVSDLIDCEELNWVVPRVVVVCIGANGGNTEDLLSQLVDKLRSRGAVHIILCRYPAPLGAAGNAAVDAAAATKGLSVPPAFDAVTVTTDGMALESAYQCGDAVHPNDAGQSRMAASLLPVLGPAVASLR